MISFAVVAVHLAICCCSSSLDVGCPCDSLPFVPAYSPSGNNVDTVILAPHIILLFTFLCVCRPGAFYIIYFRNRSVWQYRMPMLSHVASCHPKMLFRKCHLSTDVFVLSRPDTYNIYEYFPRNISSIQYNVCLVETIIPALCHFDFSVHLFIIQLWF